MAKNEGQTRAARARRQGRGGRDRPGRGRSRKATCRGSKQRYQDEVVPKLKKEFGIDNPMAVPRIEKISLNMGLGEAIQNIKILDDAVEELAALAGQRPTITRAQKSIAAFKLREGMPIGARVTLRGDRMWEFLDRLITVALPRVRDFRGVSTQELRRPRQLHAGRPRPADLPRDRLQQGREDQGDEHHHRDDRRQRRAGAVPAARARHAVRGR